MHYEKLAHHPKCVAIGECGLDYYRTRTADRDAIINKQRETVRAQFDLASDLGLPVVIHCRGAHADQLAIIREFLTQGKLVPRGVVHCFTGTLDEAHSYIKLGFFVSFTGVITFPARKDESTVDGLTPLQQLIRALPIESIMVETDAPYLTPLPHRGKRNEPAYVRHVAEKIAEIKDVVEDVAIATNANAEKLFKIKCT